MADEQGAAFMSIFTTFGSFSIAAGHPADLPDLRDARGRTARRARHRAGHRHAAQPPRADVPLRGSGLRPRSPLPSALSSASPSHIVMVLAMAAAFSASSGRHDHLLGEAHERRHRLRDRRAADTRGRRVLGVAREPHEHRQSAIRNLPEPPAANARRSRWLLGAVGPRARRSPGRLGRHDRTMASSSASVSCCVVLGLVPIARALGASDRLVYTSAGLRARRVVRPADEPLAARAT